jgi:hypothetical protein
LLEEGSLTGINPSLLEEGSLEKGSFTDINPSLLKEASLTGINPSFAGGGQSYRY